MGRIMRVLMEGLILIIEIMKTLDKIQLFLFFSSIGFMAFNKNVGIYIFESLVVLLGIIYILYYFNVAVTFWWYTSKQDGQHSFISWKKKDLICNFIMKNRSFLQKLIILESTDHQLPSSRRNLWATTF